MCIRIRQIENPISAGDWHDAPLKWIVEGPGQEFQYFSNRENARIYARIRRKSTSFNEASCLYVKGN